jgi:predicted nuclease with RNAse H fold
MNADIAFGIDLSGYATGKTVCAAVEETPTKLEVTVLLGCPFSNRYHGDSELHPIAEAETAFLIRLFSTGAGVAVDAPIDLSEIVDERRGLQIWQLTRRRVDRVLGALAPLADRIGSPTARFQNLLRDSRINNAIGRQLFETYPAASLRLIELPHRGYKGETAQSRAILDQLIFDLKMRCDTASDDEFDAAICAITALPTYRLGEAKLAEKLRLKEAEVPKGYVLLGGRPKLPISLRREQFSKWRSGVLQ